MDSSNVHSIFNLKIKNKFGFEFNLKEEQAKIISAILNGSNVIGIFPTGFGKSMCFYLIPLLLDEIRDKNNICLIISPLKGLMMDQISKATEIGIPAAGVRCREEMDDNTIRGIKDGKFSLVYLSPEMLLDSEWNKTLLKSEIYQEQVCAIVIDEVHLLDTWGEKFRPTYSRLGEIRSHLTETPFLLLTATCTTDILTSITKKLHIDQPVMIAMPPDRKNIYLQYKSESGMDAMQELLWYIQALKETGRDTPKAILYVRSVSLVGKLHCDIIGELKNGAYLNGKRSYENRFITIYHAGLSSNDQKNILEHYVKPDSIIRFVICTVAFGLGVNISDVRIIMHWGVSESVLQYWQEVGRAGRDGQKATAYMYATKPSIVHANADMKKICSGIKNSSISCFRQAILEYMIPVKKIVIKKKCEGKCKTCECSMCSCCSLCKSYCPCHLMPVIG